MLDDCTFTETHVELAALQVLGQGIVGHIYVGITLAP